LLTGLELALALLSVFLGTVIMGTVSFGMGLVVAPVLLLFLAPQSSVVIANALISLVLLLVMFQVWRHLPIRSVWGMALAGALAVPIGVLTLNAAHPTALRITIGAFILVLGILSSFNIRLPLAERPLAGPLVGFLTSLSVTTLSIGGPLAAIYVISQNLPREVMRASLAFFFLVSYSLAFLLYSWVGLVDVNTLINIGLLVPGVLVGFPIAMLLVRRMNEGVFRYVAIGVIIVGSVVLLGRELFRL
jgi:uncharacterized membrane protein YfcA